jgi:hypothetical protein
MMLTPFKELGDIAHTIFVHGKKFSVGTTHKGEFFDPPATYFCTVEFAGETDAVVQIISHTKGSQFKTGERVRFIFKS